MNKQEFLNRLEHLLSDISAEERADALTFYENYFEDAGPENEAGVIQELGSPERVAVSIKKNLAQSSGVQMEQGTCSAGDEQEAYDTNSGSYDTGDTQKTRHTDEKSSGSFTERIKRKLNEWQFYREHRTFCIVLFVAVLLVTIPAWGSILGGILSVVLGILGALVGILVACFTLALTGIIVGISLICIGIGSLAAAIAPGLFLIGLGMISLALGAVFTLATGELCGRFLPWCYRNIRDLITNSKQSAGGAAA